MPVDPGPCRWQLPDPVLARPGCEVLGVGADLSPATLLAGYRRGLFPMPQGRTLAWFSPDPRAVLPIGGFHASRSLRRRTRSFAVSVDQCFEDVLAACADRHRPGRWITRAYARAYRELHALGWAHSFEIWCQGELAGGVLGVELGGLFCGETMFRRATDASKAALWAAVAAQRGPDAQHRVFDAQWLTPHLASLGARAIGRTQYLDRLPAALALPPVIQPGAPIPLSDYLVAAGATEA